MAWGGDCSEIIESKGIMVFAGVGVRVERGGRRLAMLSRAVETASIKNKVHRCGLREEIFHLELTLFTIITNEAKKIPNSNR